MRLLVRPMVGKYKRVLQGVFQKKASMAPVLFAHCCANFFVIWSVKYGWATNYSVTHLEEAGPSDLDRLDPMCPFDRAKDWKKRCAVLLFCSNSKCF